MTNYMDNNFFMILQSIGMGDLDMAREFARYFCEANQEILSQEFLDWLEPRLLQDEGTPRFIVPPEIADLVVVEDVCTTFNPNRYYVSKREYKLLDEIIALSKAGDILANAKIPIGNTTLLYGPPGTGKTQFARFLAYTLKLPFVYMNLIRVVNSQLGGTGRNLEDVFHFVSKNQCLFMLDELDAIGANRGTINTGGSGDEMTRTTIALMQCFDRLPQSVVLVAATNRQDMLDSALRRRFTIKHEFKHFVPDELLTMLVNYLEDVNRTGDLSLSWDEKDLRTQCGIHTSHSELISLCNRAIVRAVYTGNFIVKLSDEDKRQRTLK